MQDRNTERNQKKYTNTLLLMGCTWQRNQACIITLALFMTCMLVSVIIYLLSHCYYISGKVHDSREYSCNSKPIVLTDVVVGKTTASCTNFSQAWSDAEEKAKKPAHKYIEKQHAMALYMYTKSLQNHSDNKLDTVMVDGHQANKNETICIDSKLYSSLSEAIQILKHNQVTCLKANYRTQGHLHTDVSNKQVRFGCFTLASDKRSLEKTSTCFEINTCFGADISYYSALETNHQVLIPPYEVFKVCGIHPVTTKDCNVTYKLDSNLHCVFDINTKMLHPISASSAEGVSCIAIAMFVVAVYFVVALILVKLYQKKTHHHSVSYQQPVFYYHAEVAMRKPTFSLQ